MASETDPLQTEIKTELIEISDEETDAKVEPQKRNDVSRRRVTYGQLEQLWEFLNQNKDIATGYNKTSQARELAKNLWQKIAQNLNSHGDGAVKDWKGWCKYWNDYKSKLKKLAAAIRASHQQTGEGPSEVKKMMDIEKKFLKILGDDFCTGLPGMRVEPFEQDIPETEIGSDSQLIISTSRAPTALEGEGGSEWILTLRPVQLQESPEIMDPGPSTRVTPPPLTSPPPLESPPLHSRRSPSSRVTPPSTGVPPTPPGAARRRYTRREPPMTPDLARRTLIRISNRRANIEQQNCETLKQLLQEIKEIKEMLQSRKKPNSNKPKEFSCEQCGKMFDSKYLVKKHMRTHTGERPYMCAKCGNTYTQLGHLSIHLMKHSGVKNFSCEVCTASFFRKADLDRHNRIHLGIKPYTCEICSKAFVQKNNLEMHIRIHVGDRRFQCNVCLKRFLTKSKLNLHLKRHNGKIKVDGL